MSSFEGKLVDVVSPMRKIPHEYPRRLPSARASEHAVRLNSYVRMASISCIIA